MLTSRDLIVFDQLILTIDNVKTEKNVKIFKLKIFTMPPIKMILNFSNHEIAMQVNAIVGSLNNV